MSASDQADRAAALAIGAALLAGLFVEYEITPLGRTLLPPFKALYAWTMASLPDVERARAAFDRRATPGDGERTIDDG